MIKKVLIDKANRLYQMPLDILSFLPSDERRVLLRREDLLDLASFRWPVPFGSDQIQDPKALQPASPERINNLKEEIAGWMARYHQVKLNAEKEVLIAGGISSLTFALALAYVDSGDLAFVPSLGLPLYRRAVVACGADAVSYGISAKNDWHPDFSKVGSRLGRVARLLFINSPHNPTGAELSEKELSALVVTASRENLLVVNDAAYQSIPSRLPVSLLAVDGAKRVGVELYSFAYQFGLPPLPFGFAVGNREVLGGMRSALSLFGSSIPDCYVEMALRAIRQYPNEALKQTRALLSQTAAATTDLLDPLKLDNTGAATIPYLWARIERRRPSTTIARLLYRRSRILVVPGTSFGENGQGFIRLSLTTGPQAYAEAAGRIRRRLKLLGDQEKS